MSTRAYSRADLRRHPVWTHATKGGTYLVLGVGRCSTNGARDGVEESVVYYSVDYQGLRYREVGEFLDGRFVPKPPKT